MWVSCVQVWLVLDVFTASESSAFHPTFSQRGLYRFAGRTLAEPLVNPFPEGPDKVTGDVKTATKTSDDPFQCKVRFVTQRSHQQLHQINSKTNSAHATSSTNIDGLKKGNTSPRDDSSKASSSKVHDEKQNKQVLPMKHVPAKAGSELSTEEKRDHVTSDKTGAKFRTVPSSNSVALQEKQHPQTTTKEASANWDGKEPALVTQKHSSHDTKGKNEPEVSSKSNDPTETENKHELAERLKNAAHSAQSGGVKPSPKVGKEIHSNQKTAELASPSITDTLKKASLTQASSTKVQHTTLCLDGSEATKGSKNNAQASHSPASNTQPSEDLLKLSQVSKHDSTGKIAVKASASMMDTAKLAHETGAKSNLKVTSSMQKQHSEHPDTASKAGSKPTNSLKNTTQLHSKSIIHSDHTHSKQTPKQNLHPETARKIASKTYFDSLKKASSDTQTVTSGAEKQHFDQHGTLSNGGSKSDDSSKKAVQEDGPADKRHKKDHNKLTQNFNDDSAAKNAPKAVGSLKKAALAQETSAKSRAKTTSSGNEPKQSVNHDTNSKAGTKAHDILKKTAQASHGPDGRLHPEDPSKRTHESKHDTAPKVTSEANKSPMKTAKLPHLNGTTIILKITPSTKKPLPPLHHDNGGEVGSKRARMEKPSASLAAPTASNSKVHDGKERHSKEYISNRIRNWLSSFLW